MAFTFREWLSADELFGVGSGLPDGKPLKDTSEEVIMPFRFDRMMRELTHKGPIAGNFPVRKFNDHIEWGDRVGAWTADISPHGSLRTTLRKLETDLKGSEVWVCKKVIPMIGQEFVQNEAREANLAAAIHEELLTLENGLHETPKDHYDTQKLVSRLEEASRRDMPLLFIHRGVRKIHEHHSIIQFEYRGNGVELPSALRCEQFHVNVIFHPNRGIIRIWGNEITSPTKQHKWESRTPKWDEVFMPSQSMREITDCVRTLLTTY